METKYTNVETGVMVMKGGKAWGPIYEEGKSTSFGWVSPEKAPIYNPKFCWEPTDVTYKDSPDTIELATAELVPVERQVEVVVKILR